ncbi:MAG: hypothetical protein HY289_03540 [Planctomycetes bacterium]|nr:hypothetical protein [Planctomycetota bacterium]
MQPGLIILVLKIAVVAVTVLWIASLIALARGKVRLHGRINIAFFALTLAALIGLEVIVRIISPGIFDDYFKRHDAETSMFIHLMFAVPAAVLLFVMLFTGLKHHRNYHIAAGIVFSVLWVGTFITGVFFLPHELP